MKNPLHVNRPYTYAKNYVYIQETPLPPPSFPPSLPPAQPPPAQERRCKEGGAHQGTVTEIDHGEPHFQLDYVNRREHQAEAGSQRQAHLPHRRGLCLYCLYCMPQCTMVSCTVYSPTSVTNGTTPRSAISSSPLSHWHLVKCTAPNLLWVRRYPAMVPSPHRNRVNHAPPRCTAESCQQCKMRPSASCCEDQH